MRKFLSVWPPLLLCLLLTVPASAAGTQLQIHVPQPPVRAGETFTVRVDLSDSPGLTSVQMTLTFDRDGMTCTGVTAGPLLSDALSETNPDAGNGAVIAAASAETIEGGGTLAEFAFRAETDLSALDFNIIDTSLGDGRGRPVTFTVTVRGQDTGGTDDTPEQTENPAPAQSPDSVRSGTSGGASGGSSGRTPVPAAEPDPIPEQDALPPAIPVTEPEPTREPDSGGQAVPAFTDTAGHWAEEQIAEAAARGLFGGYADGTFRPDSLLTRAQYVTVLWNWSGKPEPDGTAPFTDTGGISPDFRSAIAWAFQEGFISGTSPSAFSPGLPVTRQAAMKILFSRCGGQSGAEAVFTGVYDARYTDSGSISAWARAGVYWAVYHDILCGTTPTTLNPGGFVTRAQMAVLMVRCTDRFPPQENG